ncbi:MAG: hypothetical protein CGU28_13105 [Candidatus Dactylopiibacterium carminicum]|uniref:Glycosyltransferase subfamily 4-like N-terminal domain-containing protein n=1 Tax=Candidatus Dactylopiibacterium carminicum TaxID=857335 RepID=A0A272EP94_9RHOO|nr:glycosyltransferase [Candidatus Dactylopiibacterium carminicum]KAF7598267.1 hypothetical protein BGI27_14285 [Candidatus Dactylopiibacterium carminicum]PAS91934.1 MAG: hypothetical protein CGU29_13745 [Candidatus Dactylopiibacterium carminicum]PAS95004.1 MAG: hypothetical protein CGU28_13105 [Candidatus Dactylopiibacterium carminicum]PAS97150.1 MAG: hypothetical protein BSR46_14315 [Candidatus Dactylopiibacterium carminicum]
MKIEVVSFTGDSGLADYAVSLARALAAHAEVRVVSAQSLPGRFDALGFAVTRVFRRSRHYPLDIWRFVAGVLRRRPDWLLLQGPLKFPWLDALFIRLLHLLGIRCAVTVHDVLPHYPSFWSRYEYGFYYRSFNRVVTHSQAAAAGLKTLGVCGEILVVPHGIYDLFDLTGIDRRSARRALGLEEDEFVLLFFGHLEPRKGLMVFLEAAQALAGEVKLKFLLAGANALTTHGSQHVRRLEAARQWPNVIVHDRRIPFEEVERYFAASDVVALPYLEGTTSGVLKLALAFGKPVAASRVGDFPEQIPAGAGELFDADARIAMHFASAVQRIRANYPAYLSAMQAARGQAQWPDIAARLLAYLEAR